MDTASLHSDMMTSRPWLMNSGEPEAARKDHRKKIGSMPRKYCDHAVTLTNPIKVIEKRKSA